jgi:hypothetical protein
MILLRAFGQNAAHHDCAYRAKKSGARWIAIIDWDEYLLLRPPSGKWPPPPSISGASKVSDWARTFDDAAALKGDQHQSSSPLPSAFEFQSAFTCSTCQPTIEPPNTETMKKVQVEVPGVNVVHPTPSIPSIFVSPVRQAQWFGIGHRCKSIIVSPS